MTRPVDSTAAGLARTTISNVVEPKATGLRLNRLVPMSTRKGWVRSVESVKAL